MISLQELSWSEPIRVIRGIEGSGGASKRISRENECLACKLLPAELTAQERLGWRRRLFCQPDCHP